MNTLELFPTESKAKLSENSTAWPDTIIGIITRKFPELTTLIDKVVFTKIEKTRGYAVGYVLINKDSFRIPFVIKNFMLLPIDIFIKDGKYGYMCRRTIQSLCSSSWPFSGADQTDVTKMFKVAEYLPMPDLTLACQDVTQKRILDEVVDMMPKVAARLVEHEINSVNLKTVNDSRPVAGKVISLETNPSLGQVILHMFDGPDQALSLTAAEARFGKKVVQEVLKSGIYRQQLGDTPQVIGETDKSQYHWDSGKDTMYPVTLNMTDGAVGFKRGNVYKLKDVSHPEDGSKGFIFLTTRNTKPKYFVFKDGKDKFYTLAESSGGSHAGGAVETQTDDIERPNPPKFAGEAFGILLNNMVYGPFEILNKASMGDGEVYTIRDGFEYDKFYLHSSRNVTQILVDGDHVYVPASAKIFWLGHRMNFASPLTKTAASVKVTLTTSPDKSYFTLIDSGVTGLAPEHLQKMKKGKSISALMNAGLSEEESKNAVNQALSTGAFTFNVAPTATTSQSQQRAEIQKMEKKAYEIHRIIDSSEIIKIAAGMGDEEVVDTALNLRLMTPENVKRYRMYIPKINNTIDSLAHLTLAARLNEQAVPLNEENLTKAMSTLSEVAYELSGV